MAMDLFVVGNKDWQPIPLPRGRNLGLGTGFERALEDAGKKLTKITNSRWDVAFYVRGNALIVDELGGLKLLPQGDGLFELKAVILEEHRAIEKRFIARTVTGESEWVEQLSLTP
jgi:hypothetical protein